MSIQVQNHWFFSCITVVFGFELIRSVPWIPLPTSLAWEPEWNLWIERSRLFCYSVINLLCCFQCESFYILSHCFVFVKNFFNLLFPKFFFLTSNLFIISYSQQMSRKKFAIIFMITNNGEEGIWTLAPVLPTYWCSKPDPSAAWVLLRMPWTQRHYNTSWENFQGIPLLDFYIYDKLYIL